MLFGGFDMKRRGIIFGFALGFILLSSFPGFAQRYWRMTSPYDLNLTEPQLIRIQEMRLEFQKETLNLRARFQTLYLELETLYLKNADQETIDAKIAQMNKIDLDLEEHFQTHISEVREVLTDEQKILYDRFGGLGLGPGGLGGLGAGMGRGFAAGRAAGLGRGMGLGYGRGYGRGMRIGNSRIPGRGMMMNPALGRGMRCPYFYYWQRGYDRLRDWR